MAATASFDRPLSYGDIICLHDVENGGYISAGGIVDMRLWVDILAPGAEVPPNLRDCAFRLLARFQFTARKDVDRFLQDNGKTRDVLNEYMEKKPELKALVELEKREEGINNKENNRLLRSPILYGAVVMLQHVVSGKLVTISKTVADFQKSALKVSLEDEGNDGSLFSVIPAYKTQTEGSICRMTDVVRLESAKFVNQFIHCNPIDWSSTDWSRDLGQIVVDSMEVNAMADSNPLKVVPLAGSEEKAVLEQLQQVPVHGGDIVTLFHKDGESYICVESGALYLKKPTNTHRPLSNALWKVEYEFTDWGHERVEWQEKRYRLKHLATGKYLAVKRVMDENDIDIEREVFLANDYFDTKTLFVFSSFFASSHECIMDNDMAFISHVDGFILNEGPLCDPPGVLTSGKFRKLRISGESNRDVFVVAKVPEAEVRRVMMVIRAAAQLKGYTKKIRDLPAGIDEKSKMKTIQQVGRIGNSADGVRSMITKLIMETLGGDDKNPETRDGPNRRHVQKLLREQDCMEIAMQCILVPFQKGMTLSGTTSIYNTSYDGLLMVNKLAYRLLKAFCKDNNKNKHLLAKYIPEMMSHLGGEMKSAFALMELFKDNRSLLVKHIDDSIVKKFVSIINENGKRPRFMLFLASITTAQGLAIPANQNRVIKYFIDQGDDDDPFPHDKLHLEAQLKEMTVDETASLYTWPPGVPRPPGNTKEWVLAIRDRQKDSEWIFVNQWMGSADTVFAKDVSKNTPEELLFRYFVVNMDMFTSLLTGRNRLAFEKIVQIDDSIMGYHELLTISFHRRMPYVVRTAAIRLLRKLYVERDPYLPVPLESVLIFSDHLVDSDGISNGERVTVPHMDISLSPFNMPKFSNYKPTADFVDLLDALVKYLSETQNVDASLVGANRYLVTICDVLDDLLSFGLLWKEAKDGERNIELIKKVIVPEIVRLLDGRKDLPRSSERFKHTDQNIPVFEVKITLVKMLRKVFKIRSDLRSRLFFREVDKRFKRPLPSNKMPAIDLKVPSVGKTVSKMSLDLSKVKKEADSNGEVEPDSPEYSDDEFMQGDPDGGIPEVEALGSVKDNPLTKKTIFDEAGANAIHDMLFNGPLLHKSVAANSTDGDFVDILMDLCKYDNDDLQHKAWDLYVEHMTQRIGWAKQLYNVRPMITSHAMTMYANIMKELIVIRSQIKWLHRADPDMKRSPYEVASESVQNLTDMMVLDSEEIRKVQDMMRYAGAHEAINEVLSVPLDLHDDMSPVVPEQRDLFQLCYNFLLRMCIEANKENQALLFPFVPVWALHMGTQKLNVANTIVEIIRNNGELIADFPPKVISRFMYLIGKYGKNPRWLRIYDVMLEIDGRPVKKNQTNVLKSFLDHEKLMNFTGDFGEDELEETANTPTSAASISPVMSDKMSGVVSTFLLKGKVKTLSGSKVVRRSVLIDRKEYRKPMGSRLLYHSLCVSILAKCCKGKHRSNEAKCRALISFDVVMRNIIDLLCAPTTSEEVKNGQYCMKSPFVDFLHYVYVETNNPTAASLVTDPTNRFFSIGQNEMEEGYRPFIWTSVDDINSLCGKLEKPESMEDPEGLKYHATYVASALVPLLSTYYSLHYRLHGADTLYEAKETLTNMLVKAVIRLISNKSLCLHTTDEGVRRTFKLGEMLVRRYSPETIVPRPTYRKRTGNLDALTAWHGHDPDVVMLQVIQNCLGEVSGALGILDLQRMIGKGFRNMCNSMSKPSRVDYLRSMVKFAYENRGTMAIESLAMFCRVARAVFYIEHSTNLDQDWLDFTESRPAKRTSAQIKTLQDRLITMDVCPLVSELLIHKDSLVSTAAVRLGLVMFQTRNVGVQRTFFDHFSSDPKCTFFGGCCYQLRRASETLKKKASEVKKIKRAAEAEHLRSIGYDTLRIENASESVRNGKVTMRIPKNKVAPNSSEAKYRAGGGKKGKKAPKAKLAEKTVPKSIAMEVLLVLEGLCAGRYRPVQALMASQPNLTQSHDMIKEVVSYGLALPPEVERAFTEGDGEVIRVAIQVFKTLHSFIDGPQYQNCEALSVSSIFEMTNRLFDRASTVMSGPLAKNVSEYRTWVLRVIYDLALSDETSIAMRILEGLDWHMILHARDKIVDAIARTSKKSLKFQLIEEFNYYFFVALHVGRLDAKKLDRSDQNRCAMDGVLCLRPARCNGHCVEHAFGHNRSAEALFEQSAASIEVMRNNKVERLYFSLQSIKPLVATSRNMRISMNQGLEGAYDDNQNMRIKNFFGLMLNVLYDITHKTRLRRNIFCCVIPRINWVFRELPYYIAIIINVLICLFMEDSRLYFLQEGTNFENFPEHKRYWVLPLFRILALTHLCLSHFMLIFYFIEKSIPETFRKMNARGMFIEDIPDAQEESGAIEEVVPIHKRRLNIFLVFLPYVEFWDFESWHLGFYFVLFYPIFSWLGNWLSPFFFLYSLFDVLRDPVTILVVKSVTNNMPKLIKTGVLSIFLLYGFSCFAFISFRDRIEADSLFQAFVAMLFHLSTAQPFLDSYYSDFYDVPKDFFTEPSGGESILFETSLVLFTMTFGLVFVLILVAILSGIIIDSFGELRDDAQRIKDAVNGSCFICGLPRFTLDEQGNGFDDHLTYDHNPWNYLYFFAYVERKPHEMRSAQELAVYVAMLERSTSLFPSGRALVLEHKDTGDDDDSLENLAGMVGSMQKGMSRMQRQIETIAAQMKKPRLTRNPSVVSLNPGESTPALSSRNPVPLPVGKLTSTILTQARPSPQDSVPTTLSIQPLRSNEPMPSDPPPPPPPPPNDDDDGMSVTNS